MSRRNEYNSESSEDEEESRMRKRRRVGEAIDIEKRLESLILAVGEKSTSSLESNLEGLASVLEADLPNYRQRILKVLCDCVVSMPEKLTIYTTLIGLLNARNYNAGGEFVDVLVRMLKELLKTNQFHDAQITVRFLADLVNCRVITASSLMALFNSFTDVTLEDSIPQVRSDWYVYMVLAALPWVGRELFEKKITEFDRMLQIIENYMSKRQKIHVGALRVWSSNDPQPQEEYLDCLWAQLSSLRGTTWLERYISRPYLAFDSQLSEALQHALPQIMIPSHHKDIVYPLPSVVFRMFDYTDVPSESGTLPGSHAIERYLVEEQLHRIINTNFRERKDCATMLLAFPNKTRLPLVYMIVEVVFGQMFHLPRSPHVDIFYASLFIELCKLQPGSVPQVLAQATEMIFENLDTMNTSCIERFVLWFSHHLSNFQYQWSWDDWSSCLTGSKELPKPKFIREVLVRCMRLSYYQKIQEVCPPSYESVLPKKPVANFKFEQEGSGSLPGTMAAHKLLQAIKAKCTPEEAAILMRDLANPLKDDEGGDARYNPIKIDVFVQTLLFVGSKSFSHSCSAIARYLDFLRSLADGPEAQVCLLKSLQELWKNNQQMIVVLVDKLVRTQVVDCPAVVNWLFSPEMSSQFTSFYVWEILHSTIRKMNKQVTSQQVMLEEAKDRLEAAKRKLKGDYEDDDVEMENAAPTEEEIERMEEKLEETQSEHKNLFLVIFQRFIILLTDHLAKCESEETDFNTPWYKWVIERLQQVFLQHHEQVYHYTSTLERLMFTSDIDIHILEVFQQFCALRS